MPQDRRENELTDPPSEREKVMRELDDLIEELRQDSESFASRNQRTAREINIEVDDLELDEFHNEGLDRAQNDVINNPGEAVADTSRDKVLQDLRTQLEKVTMKLVEAQPGAKTYNLQRFLAIFSILSATSASASLIYNAIHAAQQNQPQPAPLPPDTVAKVRELVRAWNDECDVKYWNDLANYVSLSDPQVPLTLADQILFMNYTIDLSPAGTVWIWDSGQDIVDLVTQLVGAYNGSQSSATMYRLAPTLTYHGQPIPRAVTAGLLRYALSHIIVLYSAAMVTDGMRSVQLPPAPHGLGASEGGSGDEGLSEAPDDADKHVEEDANEARREEENFASHLREVKTEVTQTLSSIETTSFNADNVESAWSEWVEVPNTAVADPAPDSRLQALEKQLTQVTDDVSKAKDSNKQYNVRRYLAAFFGISIAAAAAIALMEYMTRKANGQPTDDIPPIPPETLDQIRQLVQGWKAQSDTDYWNSLATYVEKNPGSLSLADQVVFMNYTVQLCPPAEPFLWDQAKDKAALADQLVATSKNGTDLPGMYRSLSTLQYDGAPLPRAVTADVVRLALAWLIPQPAGPLRGRPAGMSLVGKRRPLGDPAARPAASPPNGIPVQLQPRLYVAEVMPGVNRVAYTRDLYALFRPAGVNNPAALSAAHQYVQPETCPFILSDADATITRLPTPAARRVRDRIDQLIKTIEAVYPVPAEETIKASSATYLMEPSGDLPVGTVVYIRRTNAALVYFVLPHIMVDPATGTPSLVGLDGPAVVAYKRPAMSIESAGSSAASIALSVAGNLVWALPPPWGPISAGALTLIQLLLAQDSYRPNQFSLVVQQLEQFIQQRDVNNDATHVKSLADWMQAQTFVLASTQVDNSTYITSTLLPELRKMVAPGDESVYNAIYDLENNLSVPGAFDILVLGVSIYLLALKMIVQLDAQLASTAHNAGDDASFASYTDLWLADYSNFLAAVNGFSQNSVTTAGWATRIANHINDFYNARLAQISEPYRYNQQKWVVATGGGSTGTSGYWVDNWGWTYKDSGAGDSDVTNFAGDTFTGGDCCHGSTRVEHADLVQQARDAHVQAVSAQLDIAYADTVNTVKKWVASIKQWNQHLPPRPPTAAPTVADGSGTVPIGNWVGGAAVRYAVAFANQSGPSQVGPWSGFKAITTKAYAVLSDLPTDSLAMTINRWIYRQFRSANGTVEPIRIVGITNATVTNYEDKKE